MACNCDNRECINFIASNKYEDPTRCKVLKIDEPMDLWWDNNVNCQHFAQSKTCRECKHRVSAFYCNEEYDYEEDYKCKIDKMVYTQYVHMGQRNDDYQCECGHFEYDE